MRAYVTMLRADRAALCAAAFLAFILIVAFVVAPLTSETAQLQNLRLRMQPPWSFDNGWAGLLGTDALGRSVLKRMIAASQITLTIALSSALLAAVLGSAIGIGAGYRGGFADSIAMRIADVILSFPMLLLALLFLYLLEPAVTNIIILLVVGRLPLYMRVARAETLSVRQMLYIDAARGLGASGFNICLKEIAPVVMPTIVTLVALDIGFIMLLESALSFLGLGVQPPNTSWGGLVAEGRRWISSSWWLTVFPGLAIFLTALSSNILSNWLRMATDPAQRWRLEAKARPLRPAEEN